MIIVIISRYIATRPLSVHLSVIVRFLPAIRNLFVFLLGTATTAAPTQPPTTAACKIKSLCCNKSI